MKRVIAIVAVVVMLSLLVSACDSGGYASEEPFTIYEGYSSNSAPAAPLPPMVSDDSVAMLFDNEYDYDMSSEEAGLSDSGTPATLSAAVGGDDGLAEKIIYTAHAEIETLEFDDTIDRVYTMIGLNGAFVENSYVSGINHEQRQYGIQSLREARFTIRVPQNRLEAMTENLDSLGNVIYLVSDAKNITSEFIDTESHLTALRAQEQSLLNMLRAADTIADMIIIEERLSDVRYTIESLTSTLRNWQNKVDYSTLTLNITEVLLLTDTEIVIDVDEPTYWEKMGDGFLSSAEGVGRFFAELFRFLVISLPVLAVLGAITAITLIILKLTVWKKSRKKRTSVKNNRPGQATVNQTAQLNVNQSEESSDSQPEHPSDRQQEHPTTDQHEREAVKEGEGPALSQQGQPVVNQPPYYPPQHPGQFPVNQYGQFPGNQPWQFPVNHQGPFPGYQHPQYPVNQTGHLQGNQQVQSPPKQTGQADHGADGASNDSND